MAKKQKAIRVLTEAELRKKYPFSGKAEDVLEDNPLKIPSRVLAINDQLGGGLVYGRILELFGYESTGKSLLAMDFCYGAQQLGGIVLWADGEGTYTKYWAEENGLNNDRVIILNDNAIEKMSDWVRDQILYQRTQLTKNEPILLVVDSIAAFDCEDKVEADQSKSKAEMGNRAKAWDAYYRKRNNFFKRYGVSVIMINQVRSKVGASMFESSECLHYDTWVPFVDGRVFKIGEVVKNRIEGNIWSLNPDTFKFEPKPIVNWVEKKIDEPWINIITDGPGSKGGKFGISCTPHHLILTSDGWKFACNLTLTDKVITKYTSIINGTLEAFLWGSFIGDSSLRLRDTNTARYRLQDSNNPEYVNWKLDKLKLFFKFTKTKANNRNRYATDFNVELGLMAKKFKTRDPLEAIEYGVIDRLTLAIWYMDDGHTTKRKNPQGKIGIASKRTNIHNLVYKLTAMGYECNVIKSGIGFTKKGLGNLSYDIREYIPECMQYKLLEKDRGYYKDFILEGQSQIKSLLTNITSIKPAGARNYRRNLKYDLTIEDNENFIAGGKDNGFIVHNTTPGGKAHQFYASQRISLVRSKQVKAKKLASGKVKILEKGASDGYKVGQNVIVQVVKNKLAPPKDSLPTQVYFREEALGYVGYNRYFGFSDILIQEGIIEKRGSRYYYKDKLLANGEDNLIEIISKRPKLRRKLISKSSVNTIGKTQDILNGMTENLYLVNLKALPEDNE